MKKVAQSLHDHSRWILGPEGTESQFLSHKIQRKVVAEVVCWMLSRKALPPVMVMLIMV